MTDRYCYPHSSERMYAVSMKVTDGQRSAIQVAQECPDCRFELLGLLHLADSAVGRKRLSNEVVEQFLENKAREDK